MTKMIKYLAFFTTLFVTSPAFSANFTTAPNTQNPGNIASGYTLPAPAGAALSLSQNTDVSTITSLNSVACPIDDDSYFRRFDLDGDHSVTGVYNIDSIDFGIEVINTSPITVTVNLYSIPNASALQTANLTLIGSATKALTAADSGTIVNTLVSGSLNATTDDLVVEIFAPDFTTNGAASFFIGSNANGQSAPSYIRSAGCGAPEITDIASLGFPNMHTILVVNGSEPEAIPTLSWFGLSTLLLLLTFFGKNTILTRKRS